MKNLLVMILAISVTIIFNSAAFAEEDFFKSIKLGALLIMIRVWNLNQRIEYEILIEDIEPWF